MDNFEKYQVTIAYPKEVKAPNKNNYPFTVEGVKQYDHDVVEYEKQKKQYIQQRDQYYKELADKEQQFRNDLEKIYDVTSLPQEVKDALYSKAYERGHHGGFREVDQEYNDLLDIIYPVLNSMKNK